MISFKWHHFQKEIIFLRIRWCLAYSLSYRDIEKRMRERGNCVDHSTINR
jgi:putative transposase